MGYLVKTKETETGSLRHLDAACQGRRLLLVQLLNMLLLFMQLSLLVQLASKGKSAAAREAASRAAYLVARAATSREAADHAAAAVRAVVAREARFKGETAGARRAATSTAGAREATGHSCDCFSYSC
jgi:multidrug resistance efflux pump